MAKKSNKAILLIGVFGGILLVVTVLIFVIMSAVSGLSAPEVSDKKVQFSIAQQSDNVQQDVRTLEEANATYEEGERRLEAAALDAERERSNALSSTSFGGGAFRAVDVQTEREEPVIESKQEVEQPKTKLKTKPRSQPRTVKPAAAATSVPASNTPAPARKKRTSFNEPATVEAQQPTEAGSITFKARIFEDVEITSTSNVRVRVLEEFTYNGCVVRRNTLLPAVAQRSSNAVTVSIQNMVVCSNRVTVNFMGYSLDGTLGLPVREDNAAEVGAREGGSSMVSGIANSAAARATGMMGIVGTAVASGISGGNRASQQVKPVLLEEGRELMFIGS